MKFENNKLYINENMYIAFLFILSLFHPICGIIFYLGLLKIVINNHLEGSLKYIIIVTLRSLLSIKAGCSLASLNTLKLMIFMLLSLYIIYVGLNNKISKKHFLILISCTLFCVLTILFSFSTGSYPITSIFKCISFGIVFCGVITGVAVTKDEIDWRKYLVQVMTPFFIVSFLVVPFSSFRIVNDNFQGIFNHVNICGIMGAIYINCLLSNKVKDSKEKLMKISFIIITLAMQYLTASRTGMIISVVTIFIYFIMNKQSKTIYLSIALVLFSFFTVYSLSDDVHKYINMAVSDYLYKGNQNDILASRRETQETAIKKYEENHLIGSGFMTPYIENHVDYSLNMSLNVEPGNIIWSLLGDVGIIGTFAFVIFIITILVSGHVRNVFLIICALGVCAGEMVFFSVNNMSTILYFMIACYMVYKN